MITVKLPIKNWNCENLTLWATRNTSTWGPVLWAVCRCDKVSQHWGGCTRKGDPRRVVNPCFPNGHQLTLPKSLSKVHFGLLCNKETFCHGCTVIISFELTKMLTCRVLVNFKEQHSQLSTSSTELSPRLLCKASICRRHTLNTERIQKHLGKSSCLSASPTLDRSEKRFCCCCCFLIGTVRWLCRYRHLLPRLTARTQTEGGINQPLSVASWSAHTSWWGYTPNTLTLTCTQVVRLHPLYLENIYILPQNEFSVLKCNEFVVDNFMS